MARMYRRVAVLNGDEAAWGGCRKFRESRLTVLRCENCHMGGKTRQGVCAYCGNQGNVTRDHVPPKTLFSKPPPIDMPTVPSCEQCNASFKKDDEYTQTVLALDFRAAAHRDVLGSMSTMARALQYFRGGAPCLDELCRSIPEWPSYDCFHRHHDALPIDEHDLLAEWDSGRKRRRFVEFREKVFRYPVVVGRTRGVEVDLSGCKPVHALIDYAKDFRDALVHPSQFIDPKTGHQSSMERLAASASIPMSRSMARPEPVRTGASPRIWVGSVLSWTPVTTGW